MLRRPRVAHRERRVLVVDEHAGGLAIEGFFDPLAVPGRGDLRRELSVHVVGQGGVGGDEQAGGELVVLGLGDEVGGDVAGSAVSSAMTATSVGPFSPSVPTTPRSTRLAAAT